MRSAPQNIFIEVLSRSTETYDRGKKFKENINVIIKLLILSII